MYGVSEPSPAWAVGSIIRVVEAVGRTIRLIAGDDSVNIYSMTHSWYHRDATTVCRSDSNTNPLLPIYIVLPDGGGAF